MIKHIEIVREHRANASGKGGLKDEKRQARGERWQMLRHVAKMGYALKYFSVKVTLNGA